MKRINRFMACVALGICAAYMPNIVSAQPSGNILAHVSNPTNCVWDLGGVANYVIFAVTNKKDGATVQITYPIAVTQNGAGRIAGKSDHASANVIADGFHVPFSGGKYSVTGSVTSRQGKGHLLFKARLSGVSTLTQHAVRANYQYDVHFDNFAKTATGTETDSAFASTRGSIKEREDVNVALSWIFTGDGSWTLTLSNIVTTGKNISGTAKVVLNSGQSFSYKVLGKFESSTGVSRLKLSASEPLTRGSSLQVVLNENNVASIRGKISGQAVNAAF